MLLVKYAAAVAVRLHIDRKYITSLSCSDLLVVSVIMSH